MKLLNMIGSGALALPIPAFTSGSVQGSGMSAQRFRKDRLPAATGLISRLRGIGHAVAPDSDSPGPLS